MICPYCKKVAATVTKGSKVYCSLCSEVVEDTSSDKQLTLKCPNCKEYSTSGYCSHCGYNFIAGVDY